LDIVKLLVVVPAPENVIGLVPVVATVRTAELRPETGVNTFDTGARPAATAEKHK
jgi:hypothetical protein